MFIFKNVTYDCRSISVRHVIIVLHLYALVMPKTNELLSLKTESLLVIIIAKFMKQRHSVGTEK